jgi:predicted dehydrogenase
VSEIRIAIVGVGRTGLTHTGNLARRARGAELVAVTTPDEKLAVGARRVC